jgi:hypothetical protein
MHPQCVVITCLRMTKTAHMKNLKDFRSDSSLAQPGLHCLELLEYDTGAAKPKS